MRIRWHGMLGTQHSWAFTQQALIRAMDNIGGHEIHLKSTNNLEYFPQDLKHLLLPGYHGALFQGEAQYIDGQGDEATIPKDKPAPEIEDENRPYDLELAYTILYQGPRRFFHDSKCRAVIWNFESSILPPGWNLYHRALNYILPSSQYSFDIFANSGIPKNKMVVVPHGVDTNVFNPNITPFKLKTKKKIKFLHNAIPHHRKLHERVIRGYVETFSGKDDVCLVLKTKFLIPPKDRPFEANVKAIIESVLKGVKNPPEIEVVSTFIPNIGSLYTACDVVVSMSACEGYNLTLNEALACGSLVIAPRHGGQLEFLNDNNSLLVDTKEMKAPQSMQYWGYMKNAVVGDPSTNHFKELLYKTYKNLDEEKERVKEAAKETVEKFSWERAAQIILDLPIPQKSIRVHHKRKVLYIVPYQMVGGGEIWIKEAISNLDHSIYEPHVVFVSGTSSEFKESLKSIGTFTEELSDSIKNCLPNEMTQQRGAALKCLIESENYSIIHFYNSFSVYKILESAWNQGFRCRIVETIHSDLSWPDSMSKVAKRGEHITLLSTISNKMGRKLLQMGNKNVIVLQQCIDWNKFNINRSRKVLNSFNIDDNSFVVGFVGRLSPEKNIPVIINCANAMPDVSFVVVGDGPQEKPLKQMASKLSNVYFVGKRNNTEEFYAAFDLLILPSLVEGMPLVILEAMTVGTPIIASDVGSIIEVVHDGLTGSLIWNPNNPQLFAKEIQRFKNNKELWQSCSTNCRSIIKAARAKAKEFNINNLYNLLF
jgi:glycosyltransferase involved in cell wall biosynthesis